MKRWLWPIALACGPWPPGSAAAATTDAFSLHAQGTYLEQYAPPFHSPYEGPSSLQPDQARETADVTVFGGVRLWDGAEFWVNPEVDQGFGLSGTHGVAGFPSGEAYKVGANDPYVRLQRAFVRDTVSLGGGPAPVDAGQNQFSQAAQADRMVITLGKFSAVDVFDTNRYAHDPRGDFMNWSIVDTGAFDYAADAWGYTVGSAAELYEGDWALRTGLFDLSKVPNGTSLDPEFRQFQGLLEAEHRQDLYGQAGRVAVTAFLSRGRMGRCDDALQQAKSAGTTPDTATVRRYAGRDGISLNLEQQVAHDVGLFARAGRSNGDVEPYEFADIDRTLSLGASATGARWNRPADTLALASVVNGISAAHRAYLAAGGQGILIGDGQLPHYGNETIAEAYYLARVSFIRVTLDYQYVAHPAYNRDRGPVSILGLRLHAEL